jgi:hypothetical protein
MASKKQQRGESKQGLVITLVFFILTTIGLGVATYYGFADQERLTAAAKKAKDDENKFKAERDWYRFQANLYRTYMGHPPQDAKAMGDLRQDKPKFDKGQSVAVTGGPSAEEKKETTEVTNLIQTLAKGLAPWDAAKEDAPPLTYERRLEQARDQYAALEKSANQLKEDKEKAEKDAKGDADKLAAAQKDFEAKLAEQQKKSEADRATDQKTIVDLRNDLNKAGVDREKATAARGQAEASLKKNQSELLTAQGEAAGLRKENTELKDKLAKREAQLAAVSERSGVDVGALEAQALDGKALQLLKAWRKDWQIVQMDRKGTSPYINLGSADRVVPQLTFSIHAAGPDGRLTPAPKGTLEVVRVVGPHLSRVRITSVKDAAADPILKGDRLFNPTWDPTLHKHVAVAGLIDLAGDGRDNTAEFVRALERQGTVVDAYLDLSGKDVTTKGKGITVSTDYLIVGDPVDGSRHPRARDGDFAKKADAAVTAAKAKAQANGVTIIGLRKYLDLIGYRSPRLAIEAAPPTGSGR